MYPALLGLFGLLLLLANQRGEVLAVAGDVAPVDTGDTLQSLGEPSAEQGQGGAVFALAGLLGHIDLFGQLQQLADPADSGQQARNVRAFLMMIRRAEGTADADGYRRIFGGRLFDDMSDHPRRAVAFTDSAGRRLYTTAAGAYQLMAVSLTPAGTSTQVNTWDRMKDRLGLEDFSPQSQDAAALQLIEDAGAMPDVRAGRFDAAVRQVRRIWASLPGAGYNQPEKSIDALRVAFTQAGGVLA